MKPIRFFFQQASLLLLLASHFGLLSAQNSHELARGPLDSASRYIRSGQVEAADRVILKANAIRWETERNYTRFFLSERKSVLVARTMGQFEESLLQNNFFRSHKSHIIYLAYLESYVRQDGGYLLMRDGHQVPVSRQRKAELFAILGI